MTPKYEQLKKNIIELCQQPKLTDAFFFAELKSLLATINEKDCLPSCFEDCFGKEEAEVSRR